MKEGRNINYIKMGNSPADCIFSLLQEQKVLTEFSGSMSLRIQGAAISKEREEERRKEKGE